MRTITYNNYTISVEKYSFSDSYVTLYYYVCGISNNDDHYYMVFSANDLTEDKALRLCKMRLEYKNKYNVKFTVNNIYNFIRYYGKEIDKFNKVFDVEMREFRIWKQKNLFKELKS